MYRRGPFINRAGASVDGSGIVSSSRSYHYNVYILRHSLLSDTLPRSSELIL